MTSSEYRPPILWKGLIAMSIGPVEVYMMSESYLSRSACSIAGSWRCARPMRSSVRSVPWPSYSSRTLTSDDTPPPPPSPSPSPSSSRPMDSPPSTRRMYSKGGIGRA